MHREFDLYVMRSKTDDTNQEKPSLRNYNKTNNDDKYILYNECETGIETYEVDLYIGFENKRVDITL